MKVRKLICFQLFALSLALTPIASAADLDHSNQVPNVQETQFMLQVPLASDTYRLAASFGMQINPETKEKSNHNGIDYTATEGTAIYASADGQVILADKAIGYGETIMIKHSTDFTTLYGHIQPGSLLVKTGDTVKRGQKIAEVGSSETSENLLHFSVFKKGAAVNPSDYFTK